MVQPEARALQALSVLGETLWRSAAMCLVWGVPRALALVVELPSWQVGERQLPSGLITLTITFGMHLRPFRRLFHLSSIAGCFSLLSLGTYF